MLGGGTVFNSVPREAWFPVDLRSLDSAGVGFRMERRMAIDYSKAKPQPHPLVQTALAAIKHYRKPGTPAIIPADAGSTDANIAVTMGIPGVSIGAAITIVPGTKSLLALAVAWTTH